METIFSTIVRTLRAGERVEIREIRGFGSQEEGLRFLNPV
jgi:hypothetical protein